MTEILMALKGKLPAVEVFALAVHKLDMCSGSKLSNLPPEVTWARKHLIMESPNDDHNIPPLC